MCIRDSLQLLLVLLNLVLDLPCGPLLRSGLGATVFRTFAQQVFHLLHLSVDSLRFPLRRDGEHIELRMGNDHGIPFVGGYPAEETFAAEWRIEVAFGNGKDVGGRIGFLELFAPLLNHVVWDDVEILARDSDSARLHAGNNPVSYTHLSILHSAGSASSAVSPPTNGMQSSFPIPSSICSPSRPSGKRRPSTLRCKR